MSVKLRKKKLSGSKISLYLDIYLNGQRQYDFLNLYLYKGTSSRIKATNKDTLELAETIRANRQTELQYSEHDIIPLSFIGGESYTGHHHTQNFFIFLCKYSYPLPDNLCILKR